MKIKFLVTGIAPEKYEFDGEKIIVDGKLYDLSIFEEGDVFEGIEGDIQPIRAVERRYGELYVTLCQKAPPGHWRGKDEWIDSTKYNPAELYIRPATEYEIVGDEYEVNINDGEKENLGEMIIRKNTDIQ